MSGTDGANQFHAAKNLAHRYGVKPNGSGARRLNGGWEKPQAFGESGEVPPVADSPVQ
jgi:hypothetical protein